MGKKQNADNKTTLLEAQKCSNYNKYQVSVVATTR